jgi:hypothetical protein
MTMMTTTMLTAMMITIIIKIKNGSFHKSKYNNKNVFTVQNKEEFPLRVIYDHIDVYLRLHSKEDI